MDQASLKKAMDSCIILKENQSVRVRIRKKNGEYRLIDLLFSPVFHENDEITSILAIGKDVTDKIHSEFENRKLQTIIEKTSDIIIISDEQEHITYINESGRNILQIPDQASVSAFLTDRFLSPSSRTVYENGKKIARRDGIWSGQMTLISERGREIPVSKVIVAHQSATDEPITYFTISRDTTERLLYHQEISRIHSYNRTLIETNIDPLVTIGPDGRITDVNKATEEVTGYSKDELIGTSFSEYFTEPDKAEQGYQRVFADGTVKNYPLIIRHRNGSTTPVEYNASVYRDESGEIQGVFASARDLSARVAHDREIARINAYNRSLIETSIDPLVTIGPDGMIKDVNTATEMITGRPRSELIGTDFSSYFTEPHKAEEGYRRVFAEGYVRNYPLVITHANGTMTPVEYNASVYRDDTGEIQGVFAAARDMTLLYSVREQMKDLLNYHLIIFERFPLPIIKFNAKMDCDFINAAYRAFSGRSEEDTDLRYIFEDIHPDDREMVYSHLVRMNEEHIPVVYECRHRYHDDSFRWIKKYDVPLFSYNGIFIGTICIIIDIGSERSSAVLIQESERRFHEIFINMIQGGVIYRRENDEGRFIIQDMNQAAEMIDQVSRLDVIGKDVQDVFPAVSEFGLLDILKRVHHTGNAEQMGEAYYADSRISGWRENYIFRLPSGDIMSMYSDIPHPRQKENYPRECEMLSSMRTDHAPDWD